MTGRMCITRSHPTGPLVAHQEYPTAAPPDGTPLPYIPAIPTPKKAKTESVDPMPSHTTPCFQTIYRNLHHLLTLRRRLKDELAEAESPAAALDPRLPDALQAALEQLEHETAALRAATPDTEDRQRVLDLLKGRRAELFARADALGTRAWCGEAPDIPDVTACRVRLRYCEHCLAGCRRLEAACRMW